MNKLIQMAKDVIADEQGQAMVEYPLIIALVSVVAIAALTTLGTNINTSLGKAAAKL